MPDQEIVEWHAWLQALWGELWETKHGERWSGMTRVPTQFRVETRRMTEDEWAQVQALILEHGIPCSMRNANMGFGCGMTLFTEVGPALYPGVPPEEPKPLLDITKSHLPLSPGEDRVLFAEGFRRFSVYTHSDENTACLADNGLPEPKPQGHYDY